MFKVGDRVKVKDLKGMSGSKSKSECYLAYETEKLSGKEFIISRIAEDGDMNFENCKWIFAQEWVEPAKKIIRNVDELDGMENGNGTTIHIEGNFVNMKYKGGLVTSTAKKFFDEDSFGFLISIGFDFEYKPGRSFEEIMSEVDEVEFKYGEENYKLCYEHDSGKWGWLCSRMYEYYGVKYFNKEQLLEAIEELNS